VRNLLELQKILANVEASDDLRMQCLIEALEDPKIKNQINYWVFRTQKDDATIEQEDFRSEVFCWLAESIKNNGYKNTFSLVTFVSNTIRFKRREYLGRERFIKYGGATDVYGYSSSKHLIKARNVHLLHAKHIKNIKKATNVVSMDTLSATVQSYDLRDPQESLVIALGGDLATENPNPSEIFGQSNTGIEKYKNRRYLKKIGMKNQTQLDLILAFLEHISDPLNQNKEFAPGAYAEKVLHKSRHTGNALYRSGVEFLFHRMESEGLAGKGAAAIFAKQKRQGRK
jgi:hypothetical protein